MKKKVSGLILICVSIGMFLMLFIPNGFFTIAAMIGLVFIGYNLLNEKK